MTRYCAILILAMVLGACERSPNIVIILADDQGWGDLSMNGNRSVSTARLFRSWSMIVTSC